MTDIWIPRLLICGQIVTLVVLGALVAVGRDSSITDGLLVVAGSLTGTSLLSAVKGKLAAEATK